MLFRRAASEPAPSAPSRVDPEELDAALDSLAIVLRTLGQTAIGTDERSREEIQAAYELCAQTLLIGQGRDAASEPNGPERNWGELRRFVSRQRSDEHDYVTRTLARMREALNDFGRVVSSGVSEGRHDDQHVQRVVADLTQALQGRNPDRIAEQAAKTVATVQTVLEQRERRYERQLARLRQHVGALRSALEAAREEAAKDVLTGLHNPAALFDHLARVSELTALTEGDPCLVLIEPDGFGQVVDQLGPAQADALLRHLADVLVRCFVRREDYLARAREERFAVLIPDSKLEITKQRVEAARQAIEKSSFLAQGTVIRVTASVGMAAHVPGEAADTWLCRADGALHEAKRRGGAGFVEAGALP